MSGNVQYIVDAKTCQDLATHQILRFFSVSGFVECGEVIFLSHLKFSLQEWGFEKEVGD